MDKKVYVVILTITFKAPQGYTPKTMSVKGCFIIEKQSPAILEKIKSENIKMYEDVCAKQMRGIKVKITASIAVEPVEFVSMQYMDMKNISKWSKK